MRKTSFLLSIISLFAVLVLPGRSFAAPRDLVLDSQGTVWYLNQLFQRRGFPSADIFHANGFNFQQVRRATAADLALSIGPVMTMPNGVVIKAANDPTVYLLMNNIRVPFSSAEQFHSAGFSFNQVITLKSSVVVGMPISRISPLSAIAGATIVAE